MASLELRPGETLIKESNMMTGMKKGKGSLTNERFALYARPNTMMFFGLLGELLVNLIIKPKLELEFPVGSLRSIERMRMGFVNHWMKITLTDGNTYQITGYNWDQWFNAFSQALAGQGMRFNQLSDKVWEVAK
jgi:hypothetical protein